MKKLTQAIELTRSRLEGYRKHGLKETPTRTIVIDPILEALGWDVRDPDEVELEHPTVDGKAVDYALKINAKPVLLVEAKPLDDPLNDVKGITQVVGYAANEGIVWCILTNGVRWKVYRSVEKCPAPDKLLFEVSLDPVDLPGVGVEDLARQLWRFSREETAKGTLDSFGEQTFTDSKVRKALEGILRDPPRPFLNLMKGVIGDDTLAPNKLKESLARLGFPGAIGMQIPPLPTGDGWASLPSAKATALAGETRVKTGLPPGKGAYTEESHISGMSQEVIELYKAIDGFCLSQAPGTVNRTYRKMYIGYKKGNRAFCGVVIQRGGLRVFLKAKYSRLQNPPPFARDVSNIGHWAPGDLELAITEMGQMELALPLIRLSLEAQG